MSSASSSKDATVTCPSCSSAIAYRQLNAHLDRCLGLVEAKAGPSHPSSSPSASIFQPAQRKRADRSPTGTTAIATNGSIFESVSKKAKVEEGNSSNVRPIDAPSASRPSNAPSIPTLPSSSARDRLDSVAPLAERLRPRSLDDFVGQSGVVDGPLKALLRKGIVPNAILWGPPGTGKTTLARILARTPSTNGGPPFRFVEVSATTATTTDIKKIFDEATNRLTLTGQRTILFIDEIQRFSRAQQDVFLPVIEKGFCTLLAATTENPSFRLQGALLSRMRVFVLTKLSVDECFEVLRRARERVQATEPVTAEDESPSNYQETIDDAMLRWIATMADGDARTALGALEIALVTVNRSATSEERLASLQTNLKRTTMQYDRTGDHHYDTISALHKSIRGSDADASLYWLARMVESGDDPLFIARRLIVAASEDCNTLEALQMATACYQACQVVGLPECAEPLAQCVVFLAESTKSTRAYRGWKKAQKLVRESYNYPVPLHIRNAPTKLMRQLGNGKEYRYEPSFAHPVVQEYFPPELKGTRLVSPPQSPLLGKRVEPDDLTEDLALNGDDKEEALPHASHIGSSTSASNTMPKANGIGPGACQRIFQIGARSVDLDLLEEWERERNGGQPWSGRKGLMQRLQRGAQDQDTDESPVVFDHDDRQ